MIRLILEAVKEWVESLLEARGRKFDVMPSIEQLFELPLNIFSISAFVMLMSDRAVSNSVLVPSNPPSIADS